MPDNKVRIVIVDDSLVVRSVVERILGRRRDFAIAASLSSAHQAVDFLNDNRVDIVLLDIEMPDRNGLDALPDLVRVGDGARILVLSSLCEEGGPATLKALAQGACDTLAKPGRSHFSGQFGELLCEKIDRLVRPSQISHSVIVAPPRVEEGAQPAIECIAIGASTGGIAAIHQFLAALPDSMNAPIFITQHLPATFLPFLVRQLQDVQTRTVRLAEQDMRVEANHIYVAPGHAHLQCVRDKKGVRIALFNGPTAARYTPSVDPMFESLGQIFGRRAVAVVMSGMGRDGLLGAEAMAEHGCSVLVQDPDSSVVWGMPGVIAQAGLAQAVLPPDQIAERIARRASMPLAIAAGAKS